MNKILLKKLGTKQNSRDDCLLFMVDNIEGLMESFDKNFQNGLILIAGKIWVHNNGFFQELWMFIMVRK